MGTLPMMGGVSFAHNAFQSKTVLPSTLFPITGGTPVPRRAGGLVLLLLFLATGLFAQEHHVSPATAGEIAGEGTYRLAAGVHRLEPVVVFGALVLLGPEEGEAVLEAARDGVLFEVRGSLTLDGITVAAPPRAEPLIAVEPGGQLSLARSRFTGSGARLRARGADVRVEETTFFRAATALETSGGGSVLLRGSEFLGEPETRAPLLVLGGPASIEIEGCTFRSVERILAADGSASVRVRGVEAAWLGAGGFLVRNPAGAVSFAGLTFAGPCVGSAVHVVGGAPAEPLPPLELTGIRAEVGAGGPGGPGFLTIADPGAFERVVLSDCVLRGAGSVGVQVLSRGEARGASVAISASTLQGWGSGIEMHAEQSGRLAVLVADTHMDGNGVGLDVAGAGLSLEARALSASANRVGVRVGGGAHAALADARLTHSVEAAVRVGDKGALTLRRSHLLANGIGVDVAEDAGAVDLGTREDAGGNRFEVRGARTWTVRTKSPEPIPAFGNTWGEQRAYTGAVAIDDLIDDGDAANPIPETGPIAETGGGTVLVDSQRGQATRLRWDAAASRATPGYGTDVFRSFADIEPVLGDLKALELGAGEYVLPVLHAGLRELAGAGRGRTILRPGPDAVAAVAASGEAFLLRDLTIVLPEETRPPAVAWTGGKLQLERLTIEGAGPGVLRVAPGEGAVELADVVVAAGGADGGTVLDVGARPSIWDGVRVTLAGPLTALETHGRAALRRTTIAYEAAHEGPGVVLRGEASAAQLTVTGPCATAVELAAADSPSTATLTQARLEGFRAAGIRLSGGAGHDLFVRDARLTANEDAGFRAAGLSVAPQARLALRIDDFEATNARPGLDVAGAARAMVLDGIVLRLNGSHNAVESEEQGIVLALAPGTGRRTLAGAEVGGYDVGLDVTRQHDDATTLVLGNFDARSACRFLRNGIGLRLSSPTARVAMREDRNRSLLAENSAAVLVEAGALMMENVRVENNQTGVIVRGGVADLGGGALGSRGGNVLWPQAGPFAIVNEAPAAVAARHNAWGAMKAFLKTDGAPISDARRNPAVGVVETDPPR